ncbi:MAG TPA: SUF system NifU family Fe-S cluster assembly protein [Acholeplasmatales bacterium]|nr:MAG: SUF system NifU family Fe-S cluster assembly protein [Tenericutes bacterium GWF2_57_13]HAQ56173.1 SUF system NifU family Fe-S cluster assembly protein [Acholeplasmatales bacterium]
MADLDNLYRQIIMEHYKNPRNKGLSEQPGYVTAHIKNPSCGDDITVQTLFADGTVKDCRHDGHGCSICCASASVMTETVIGKTVAEALLLADNYLKLVSNKEYDASVDLEEAAVFAGVNQFPARVKCASIAWQAFVRTIEEQK